MGSLRYIVLLRILDRKHRGVGKEVKIEAQTQTLLRFVFILHLTQLYAPQKAPMLQPPSEPHRPTKRITLVDPLERRNRLALILIQRMANHCPVRQINLALWLLLEC